MLLSNFASGGEALFVGAIIGLGMFLLLYFIRTAKSKGKEIISEQRLKRNPYDTKSLMNLASSNLGKDIKLSISQLEKVIRLDPCNYDAALALCIAYHYEGQYNNSRKILIELFEGKKITWLNDVHDLSRDQFILAKYFYGHIKYLDGDQELADEIKAYVNGSCQESQELNKIVEGLNLY